MFLRAIIIDDERRGINALKVTIEKHIEDLKIVAFHSKANEGIESIENYKPEIVFLDINMPEMNGFELLEKLAWRDFNLVFTTAHREYGLKALKNNAIDYLLKPVDPKELIIAVNKIRARLKENIEGMTRFNYAELMNILQTNDVKHRIMVNSKSGVELVELDEIIFLESNSNYTTIVLNDSRKILAGKSLKEFESQLCLEDSKFMRVHQSFIINLDKVTRYLKTSDFVIMCQEQKIPVSKSKKDNFFKWLNI